MDVVGGRLLVRVGQDGGEGVEVAGGVEDAAGDAGPFVVGEVPVAGCGAKGDVEVPRLGPLVLGSRRGQEPRVRAVEVAGLLVELGGGV
ncbi:hypothetical protein ACTWP5_25765 [Streptomyces sp. 4N509B]|uniref:hypothetical protein n=1 Tax=Streptomyces sp. 4N509B TaxID=3457413 RepID=UPI003FD2C14A